MASVGDLAKKFKQFAAEFATGKIVELAARDTMTLSVPRIFQKGITTNGGSFTYSTKPGYFTNGPKASNKKGKTGKTIKTGFYPGGYAEFRSQQGRENSFVNWRLTNELQSDYANAKISVKADQVAKGVPIKVNNNTYLITLNKQINIDKKAGLEKKYGTIFQLTVDEEVQFTKTSDFLLGKLVNKVFGA